MKARMVRQASYFGLAKAANMAFAIAVAILAARNPAQGEAARFLFFQPLLFLLASLVPLGINMELMERVPQSGPVDRGEATWTLLAEGVAYVALGSLVSGLLLAMLGAGGGSFEVWHGVVAIWLFWQGTSMLSGEALRANGEVFLAALSQGTVAQGVIFVFMVWTTAQGHPLSFLALALVSSLAQFLGAVSSFVRLWKFAKAPRWVWVRAGLVQAAQGWQRPWAKVSGRAGRLGATVFVGLAQQVDTILAKIVLPAVPFNDFVVASRLGNLALIPRMLVLRAFGPQLSEGAGASRERIKSLNKRIGIAQFVLGAVGVLALLIGAVTMPWMRNFLGTSTEVRLVAVILVGRLVGVSSGVPDFLLSMQGRFREVSLTMGGAYFVLYGLCLLFLATWGSQDAVLWVAVSLSFAFAASRWVLRHRLSGEGWHAG